MYRRTRDLTAKFEEENGSLICRELLHILGRENTIRITLASELLSRSDLPMIQIAFACGFQNVRNFNRVFKEITGSTLSESSRIAGNEPRHFTYYKSIGDGAAYRTCGGGCGADGP